VIVTTTVAQLVPTTAIAAESAELPATGSSSTPRRLALGAGLIATGVALQLVERRTRAR
jgi:hypothetical protein